VSGYSNLIQPTKTDSINRPLQQNNKTESECNMKTMKQARKDAGYTQEEVCEELGITQGALSQIENGQKLFSQQRLEDVCNLYGVHPSEIEHAFSERKLKRIKTNTTNNKRAGALRFALSQIVPPEHMDKVIEIAGMIIEVEGK
jgi:transcriptional regulator with XRE-family HTH domain